VGTLGTTEVMLLLRVDRGCSIDEAVRNHPLSPARAGPRGVEM